MTSEPLTRADHRELHPLVSPGPVTPPDRLWSADEWELIRHGFRSRDMEERWDALVEDDRLHLHRSWTGYGVYEADFAQEGGGRRIVAARGSKVTRDRADVHGAFLEILVFNVLLGRSPRDVRDVWERFEELGGFSALYKADPPETPQH